MSFVRYSGQPLTRLIFPLIVTGQLLLADAGLAVARSSAGQETASMAGPQTEEVVSGGDTEIQSSSTVGYPVRIEQLFLPGSELTGRPLEERDSPLSVRVLDSFAHGDGYRYDLEWTGYQLGRMNLCSGLVRRDGSTTDDLPKIWVEVSSELPPGQVKPHEIPPSPPEVTGLYSGLMIVLGGLWTLGLLAILFGGRAKQHSLTSRERRLTVADRLHPLLAQAATGELDSEERAALERVLLAFWRKRLRLEQVPPEKLFPQLKQHAEAAALFNQLEIWLHAPPAEQTLDWQNLLAPYRSMDLSELELE